MIETLEHARKLRELYEELDRQIAALQASASVAGSDADRDDENAARHRLGRRSIGLIVDEILMFNDSDLFGQKARLDAAGRLMMLSHHLEEPLLEAEAERMSGRVKIPDDF